MSSSRIQYKRALITGGGSGINLELAKALHERGISILIADIALHRDATEWLEKTSLKGGDARVLFQKTNVTSWDEIEAAFDFFEAQFGGPPQIIVPGAGIYEASSAGFWDDRDAASHYKLFDINLVHPIKTTRIAIRRLRQAQLPGVILHLSSIVAQKPSVVLPLYSASKAAISQFIRCMSPLEEICGIRVVGVAPGVVDTPLFRDNPGALNHIDMQKDFLLPTDEVVRAMLSLLMETKYPSGTVLEVGDIGGWREVELLNDPGPQGRSTKPRSKAQEALKLVHHTLNHDARRRDSVPKL